LRRAARRLFSKLIDGSSRRQHDDYHHDHDGRLPGARSGRRSRALTQPFDLTSTRPARDGSLCASLSRAGPPDHGAVTMIDPDDHRSLAQRLDLAHFQDDAPGMAFWHPHGLGLYRQLEEASRRHVAAEGYHEVRTPQLLRRPVWELSGHWQHFAGGMFRVDDGSVEAALKPVSCPGHIQIVKRGAPSYRDLPIRLAELGLVHRDEPGGTLHGLLRLRQFTQDDGHVFCTDDQAEAEVERFCRNLPGFYRAFGFDKLSIALSTRPDDRAGDDASWDRAEAALKAVLDRIGAPYTLQPGQGAFYGPKIEYALEDRLGRAWQCGTIQFDLVMPVRFDVRYVDAAGDRRPLVMLHRALYGSLERFLGVLLEHHGAALPPWLSPVQVVVLPVAGGNAWADELARSLRGRGLRVRVDDRAETLARRIAEAHDQGVPFAAVVGSREAEARTVAVRRRDGQQVAAVDDAIATIATACAAPF
jgi:threonyl-tRNA synthetase